MSRTAARRTPQGADDGEGRRPLGEIFVELGFVTRPQLDAALAEQLRTGVRLGEILVEQGSLTRLDLATALAEHWEPHPYPENGGAEWLRNGLAWPEGTVAHLEPEPPPTENGSAGGSVVGRDEIERSLAELRDALESFAGVRAADAVAAGARLSGAEGAIAALTARLDALTELVTGLRADLTSLVERGAADDPAEVAALRVETESLSGRFDELLGLRHADAHAARAAGARLDGRLAALEALADDRADDGRTAELESLGEELAELGRRLDVQGAIGEEQARAIENALLEGLNALGARLIRSAKKRGKPRKGLRRSIEAPRRRDRGCRGAGRGAELGRGAGRMRGICSDRVRLSVGRASRPARCRSVGRARR